MKITTTIKFNWGSSDSEVIPEEHVNQLEDDAIEHITKMTGDGFTSGELHTNVNTSSDPESGVDYSGWWSIRSEREQGVVDHV